MIRWLHDLVAEDAFDRAEAYLTSCPVKLRKWPLWARFLRYIMGRKRPVSHV